MLCSHVRAAGRKEHGGGEWLALEGGGGGLGDGESSSLWKKESLGKKGSVRDTGEEHEREKTSRGGTRENALGS